MYHTYVLKSMTSDHYYIGQTNNLERRVRQHNSGHSSYASHRGPYIIVYTEAYTTRSEAVKREKYFKTGRGREEIKSMGR